MIEDENVEKGQHINSVFNTYSPLYLVNKVYTLIHINKTYKMWITC